MWARYGVITKVVGGVGYYVFVVELLDSNLRPFPFDVFVQTCNDFFVENDIANFFKNTNYLCATQHSSNKTMNIHSPVTTSSNSLVNLPTVPASHGNRQVIVFFLILHPFWYLFHTNLLHVQT